ncbi:hypothetical protein L204_103033 [Cryptococcus depauperatus]
MVSQRFSVVDVKVVLTTQNDLDKSIVWDFETQLLHWIGILNNSSWSLSYTIPKASAPGFVAMTSSSLVVVPSATVPTSTVPIPNIRRSLKTTYERLDKDFV